MAKMTDLERFNKIKELIIRGHQDKLKVKDVHVFGYQFDYFTKLYGETNLYWFGKHEVIEKIAPLNSESNNDNRPGIKKDKVLYVCVHDTASAAESADSKAHASYVSNGGGGTSWHYSSGDTGIYHQIPDDEIAYHAGDGLKIKEEYFDTGVKYSTKYPVIEIKDNKFLINGELSLLSTPKLEIVDDNGTLKYSSGGVIQGGKVPEGSVVGVVDINFKTSMINDQGLKMIKGENGNYFMGPVYYNRGFGYIANRLGNLYSIGIETMVNKGSNLLLTWHRTAKLVASLLVENNLCIDDVKPHHYFSGKPCPQTMRYNKEWPHFMEMVKIEFEMLQLIAEDVSIEYNSSLDIDNFGVLTNETAVKNISYTVVLKVGNIKEELIFESTL